MLTYGATLPVVKVGRIAGRRARKAATSPTEPGEDGEIPSFRGHVHHGAPTIEARIPDPERMVERDHQRDLDPQPRPRVHEGGFRQILLRVQLELGTRSSSPDRSKGAVTSSSRPRSRRSFMAACGSTPSPRSSTSDAWTSHEGLGVDDEELLTRRECSLDGAHLVRLLRAERLGSASARARRTAPTSSSSPACTTRSASRSGATPDELIEICQRLDPARMPGRLTLVSRMGAEHVFELLPPLIQQ